jgi:GT2 family glycosyltransferase
MTISVIIATYNRSALLAECLESLGRQRFHAGDEVIVVDNASTDDTPAVVEAFARTSRAAVLLLAEERPGKTPALAAGISRASGTVLALTDDDVCVDDGWIDAIRARFADPAVALVAGRIEPRWQRRAPAWLTLGRDSYGRLSAPLGLVHYGPEQPLGARTALGGNLAIRRDVLDAVGGFAAHLGRWRGTLLSGEDHDLSQRVVAGGHVAVYDPAISVRHWVPAARLKLSYFLRWFWWLGVTHSMLDALDGRATRGPAWPPRYLWKFGAVAVLRAVVELGRGQTSTSVERLMDAAFAAGYICDRLWLRALRTLRPGRGLAPHAGRLPSARADANPPAVPISGERAGESRESGFGELEVDDARVKQVAGQPAMRGFERKAEGH